MITLLIASALAVSIFGVAYYQSYRDKLRWRRIVTGMSLFGERNDIPPLEFEGKNFESHDRRVMVIWGNMKRSGFDTVFEARQRVERDKQAGKSIANGARIFAWDGESWKQRSQI